MEEAWLWRWKHFFGWLFGFVGVILTVITGFELLSKFQAAQNNISIVSTVYVFVVTFSILIVSIYYVFNSIRKERYANIVRSLHSVNHQARDLYTYILAMEPRGQSKQAYENFLNSAKSMFGAILDQTVIVYTTLTSTHCRAAIKLTYPLERPGANDEVHVFTLARDKSSRQDCKDRDNWRVQHNSDPLDGNPHLARIFSSANQTWHFISNNLKLDKAYRSTSVIAYNPEIVTKPLPDGKKWALPYRSCVTCVIGQAAFEQCPDLPTKIQGFLTVDSESRGVFEERWDVQVLFMIADALYGPLREYQAAANRGKDAS